MGQVLHGSARTTVAVRRAVQHRQDNLQSLATRCRINPKMVAKWRKRPTTADARRGPKPATTVLSATQEAIAVAFRRHTLLAPRHRCFHRHGINRLPLGEDGQSPPKKKSKDDPIGYLPVDFAEVRIREGKQYLFVAIDRTSKVAFTERRPYASRLLAGRRARTSGSRATSTRPTSATNWACSTGSATWG